MSEESIRFMDDIDEEENNLEMEEEDVFIAEKSVIKRKSPSNTSVENVLETSVEIHPVPREAASPQKLRTILVKPAPDSTIQNGGIRVVPALKLEHGSSSSPKSASSLLLSLNEASKTKGLNEVLPWQQKSLEDEAVEVASTHHKDSLTDKTLGPGYFHR